MVVVAEVRQVIPVRVFLADCVDDEASARAQVAERLDDGLPRGRRVDDCVQRLRYAFGRVARPRRAKLEAAYPLAKDFLEQSAVEQELFGKPLKRGANDAAVAAFDRLAKGRYVLFTGNIMSPAADGFELAVRYTPREATDPMGLTATWFPVRFQNVEGYDQAQYRGGEPTAILAKYEGKQQTSAAADVILLEQWDFATP